MDEGIAGKGTRLKPGPLAGGKEQGERLKEQGTRLKPGPLAGLVPRLREARSKEQGTRLKPGPLAGLVPRLREERSKEKGESPELRSEQPATNNQHPGAGSMKN